MALGEPQLKRGVLGYRKSSVQAAIADLNETYHRLLIERNELSTKHKVASSDLERVAAEVVDLEAQLSLVAEQLEAERVSSAEATAKLEAAEVRARELAEGKTVVEEQLHVAERARRESDGRVAELETRIEAERLAAREASRQAEEAVARASASDAAAAQVAHDLADLRAELEVARTEARAAAASRSSDSERAAVVERELARVRDEFAHAREELARSRREIEELRARPTTAAAAEASGGVWTARNASPTGAPAATDEIAAAFVMAEQAMDRLLREGRQRLDEEVEALERRRDDLTADLQAIEARTRNLLRANAGVDRAVRDAREMIDGVEIAIGAALQPVLGSLTWVDREIAALEQAVSDPGGPTAGRDEGSAGPPAVSEGPGPDERGEHDPAPRAGPVQWLRPPDDRAS